ncbi:MAG: DUF748 domain-containing protein [Proteobacteria bacterium]|nr:DUF748 domain-containing protein [Pseudomonadota bacterium]
MDPFADSIAFKAEEIGCRVSQVLQRIKNHRWIRRVAWALGCLLGFWLLAWLIVPPVARAQIERHASLALGRKVTVAKVEFLPWTLEATLRDLSIASADGKSSQVQVGRIYMDAALQSLWRLAPVIDALQVDEPVIHITQTAPGHYDFDDVLEHLAQQPQPKDDKAAPQRFALYNLALRGGAVDFDDRTVGKVQTLRRLRLDVPFLSNFSADREVKVTPRLAFELNGSAFDTAAQTTPFAADRQTEVHLRIDGFDLAPFSGYMPSSVPVRLKSGVLDADLRLGFEQAAAPLFTLSGGVRLHDVQTTDAKGERLLDFTGMQLALKEVRPLQRSVDIDSIDWHGAHVYLRRDASGALVLPGLAPATGEKGATARSAPASQEAAWKLRLGRLSMHDGVVDWSDASLPGGKAQWKAENLQLNASAIELPFQHPLRFGLSTQLTGGAGSKAEAARLALQGQATDTQAQVAVSMRGFPMAMAAPYLASVLKPGLTGTLDVDLGLAKNGDALAAKLAKLTLGKLALSCSAQEKCEALRRAGIVDAGKTSVAEVGHLEISDSLVQLPQNRVVLGRVLVQQPRMLVSRAAKGAWMFEQWLPDAPAAVANAKPAAVREPAPWKLKLGDLEVEGANLAFRDEAAPKPVALNASGLQLRVREFSYADGRIAPTEVRLDTRVAAAGGRAEPGRLRYEGSVAMAPALAVQGKLRAQHLPLHAFEPYVTLDLNVNILRAEGSFAGDLRYVQEKAGPLVSVAGDMSLDEVRVRAKDEAAAQEDAKESLRLSERGEDLLRWKSLGLRGVAVNLKPGRPLELDVKQTAFSDLFARIIVHDNGRINLQDIRKAPPGEEAAAAAAKDATPPTASDAAQTVAQPVDPMAPVLRFGPVTLTNGSVRFSDFFIKPNYSADLSDLNGSLSAFSSVPPVADGEPQMAELQLRGRAQGTASLEVSGKLNPLAKPLALDIQAHMSDLELPPLSPYSVKYAGHGIERGKLSMDVVYKVLPNGQLTATNKLVLHQLAFGEQVEGAPASLPVKLAVALLADRNGVIDVDLPISGSLNDPQFSLGGVILKVIGNLIMKAVTAPFSLLAGMFSGSDEQGFIVFAPGSAQLDDKARQQLDKMAQALDNRPALKVTVVGWAQPDAEADAWKRLRLRDLVQAQKRRAAVNAGASAAEVAPVSDAEYPALLKEVYQRADIKKPRNMIGLAKDLPPGEMEALLLQSIEVPANAMQELALARGVAVRDYLANRKVAADRLFVGAPKLQPAGEGGWTPKAELTLATR